MDSSPKLAKVNLLILCVKYALVELIQNLAKTRASYALCMYVLSEFIYVCIIRVCLQRLIEFGKNRQLLEQF